jgi:carboxypeptidase PM20D1
MDCERLSSSGSSIKLDAAAQRLAGALAIRTVSHAIRTHEDDDAFLAFHRYLEENFPLAHSALTREVVGEDYALLYTWKGTDAGAEPWLLSSHQDVVSDEVEAKLHWTEPPFAGRISTGQIWGRGALDLKITLIGALEAVEFLLARNFRPRRTIYFAFGADEEIGGKRGARAIAGRLRGEGVRLAFTLDEGGMVLSGSVPGVASPVAFVGVAEKGEVLARLVAEGTPGHSSMPGGTSAITRLVHAIAAIERHPMAAELSSPVSDTFFWLAPHARQPYREIYRSCKLFGRPILAFLRRSPMADAAVRTTLATTMVRAGSQANVIPAIATALVHARVKPGDRVDGVISHLRSVVAPYRVKVEVVEVREASRISDTDTPEFRVLCEVARSVTPGVVVAPFLSLNATDSRHYETLTRNQYRFVPVQLDSSDLRGIHGVDEHVSVANYYRVVHFLIEFIRNIDRIEADGHDSPELARRSEGK